MDGWVGGWVDGWVDGWMDGGESRVKDCLQQSKTHFSVKKKGNFLCAFFDETSWGDFRKIYIQLRLKIWVF